MPTVSVAVPVRNEIARLPRLLQALALQQNAPTFSLCLFFDNCRDGSETVVETLAAGLPFPILSGRCVEGGPPNAGIARHRAAELTLTDVGDGTLLTTDADSQPAPDWIAANLAALTHADLVAGRIVRSSGETPLQDRLERYRDRLHVLRRALDPVCWEDRTTHHWVSGASLAMRARTYRALGGFGALANGEDAAFGDTAARAGLRLRRDARVIVQTSSRRTGRATAGFATMLAAFDRFSADPSVIHPADEAWRFSSQASARTWHRTGALTRAASHLRLPLSEVMQVAGECPNGEAFAARIVGSPPGGLRSVPLAQAETILAGLEAGIEETGVEGTA